MTSTAESCVALLTDRSQTVSTAESITAGMIVAELATVPGASVVLRGGIAAYATEVKVSVLGVDAEVIRQHGVISGACAEAMARRARILLASDWSVASTGVAGPTAQEDQRVGTVFVAVAGRATVVVERLQLAGDRADIRRQSRDSALALLLRAISGAVDSGGGTPGPPSVLERVSRTVTPNDG